MGKAYGSEKIMGCGGADEDKEKQVQVHDPDEGGDVEPDGVKCSVFVGPTMRINLWTTDDHTVGQVTTKVNEILKDYDGWDGGEITALSSTWALADHLEYCSDDKLTELDGYDENKASSTLHFLGVNPETCQIESYDGFDGDHYTSDWAEDESKHEINYKQSF